jgi:hypothetical protein
MDQATIQWEDIPTDLAITPLVDSALDLAGTTREVLAPEDWLEDFLQLMVWDPEVITILATLHSLEVWEPEIWD